MSAQASQQSVHSSSSGGVGGVPHVAKSGGWGVGSLAGAGTIMLGGGDEGVGSASSSSKGGISAGRKPGSQHAALAVTGTAVLVAGSHQPLVADDVFGGEDGDGNGEGGFEVIRGVGAPLPLAGHGGLANEASRYSSSSSFTAAGGGAGGVQLRSSHSRMRVGAVQPAAAAQHTESLAVQDMEGDVDAVLGGGGSEHDDDEDDDDGLPADLAAKLAAFETAGAGAAGAGAAGVGDAGGGYAESDGGGGGAVDESEDEDGGPSIFELMNHKQGSWRAA